MMEKNLVACFKGKSRRCCLDAKKNKAGKNVPCTISGSTNHAIGLINKERKFKKATGRKISNILLKFTGTDCLFMTEALEFVIMD